ncbi:uncharacterized protein HMPREF1541_09626 [Cyphellophora europaea CBS 101466]|uniref:Myb-like domain-containing protein n=1 Tax=Cyphellophora europaea (strain CBS 101466) TaxID=1220924 RepID=W2SCN2_CYPE1|nr:uncharacterized protein HMPREF1541_09626 [Cyphellophora europaea CBS 101466]ETN45793.1 hypothetical protein HMPREF1541_09626 [Cyphellophora europaea CBS 101466]
MPSSRGGLSRQRRDAPQSPQKSQPAANSPRPTRRSTRSASRDREVPSSAPPAQELDAVIEEEVSDENGNREPSVGQSDSDISATTNSELQSLDAELIIDCLPSLCDDSTKILNLFRGVDGPTLAQLSESIHDPSTTACKRFELHVNRYGVSASAFGTTNRLFLNSEMIVLRLKADNDAVDNGRWRPDAVLYLANLAFFLATIVGGGDEQIDVALRRSYPVFPSLFTSIDPSSRFATKLIEETVDYGNKLRTQVFIKHARENMDQPNFDPDDILRQVFYSSDSGLGGLDFTGDRFTQCAEQVNSHIRQLRTFITQDSTTPIRLEELEAQYTWPEFMFQTQQWVMARRQELEASLGAQDGVADIVDHLQRGELTLEYPESSHIVSSPARTRETHGTTAATGQLVKSLQWMKAHNAQLSGLPMTDVDSQSQSAQGEIAESVADDNMANFGPDMVINDQDLQLANMLTSQFEAERAATQSQQIMAQLAVQAEEANKENRGPIAANLPAANPAPRFTDRQEGAQRIPWEEATQPRDHNGKRAAADSDDDEDDFVTDARPQAKRSHMEDNTLDPRLRHNPTSTIEMEEVGTSQPNLPPSAQPRPLSGRGGNKTGVVAALPASSGVTATQRSPVSSAGPSTSTDAVRPQSQASDVDVSASQSYRLVQERAKVATRELKHRQALPLITEGLPGESTQGPASPASQPAATYQERKAWTMQEETALIDFIGVYGPAYSKILKADNEEPVKYLQHRGQVQLKDKARNIKFAYLKAGDSLPAGFGAVSIGAKMVAKLREMGIEVEVSAGVDLTTRLRDKC